MSAAAASPRATRRALWLLTYAPTVWALHFLASYVSAALYCAKWADATGVLGPVRLLIGLFTVLALLAIGVTAWRGYRQHRYGEDGAVPHDAATAADRHRFLGFATLLLCGLSAVATIYVAMAVIFIGSCR